MKYPLRGDYDTAIRNLEKFVFDDILKVGEPAKQSRNPRLLRSFNGGKAIVYEIQTSSKAYALKCWVEDLGDLKNRYKEIDNYLKKSNLPYFVDFTYKEQGILVNGGKFPTVRMEWIDNISFKNFISSNVAKPDLIRCFAEEFLEMVKVLHQNHISHGDLQHGNIIINKQDRKIFLIDYDSLFVPALFNEKDNIKGLPGYQHPNRNKLDKLSPKSDYFSELIIYLSLLVISRKPDYWQSIEEEERLLFSEQDLANPYSSKIFIEIKKISDEINYFTNELERFCKEADIEKLQPLEELIDAYTGLKDAYVGSKIEWDFTPNLPNYKSPSCPNPAIEKIQVNDWDAVFGSPPIPGNSSSLGNNWDAVFGSPPIPGNSSSPGNNWDAAFNSPPIPGNKPALNKPSHNSTGNKPVPSQAENDSIWSKFIRIVSTAWKKFKDIF